MFIELTDHLRCTKDHAESFLVLLPDRMNGRRVEAGSLGCPNCGAVVAVVDGIPDFGGTPPPPEPSSLTAAGISAMLGLSGPGGYIAVFGSAGGLAAEIAQSLPGIRLVLINPPAGTLDSDFASVIRGGRSALKSKSMRGVVVSSDHAGDHGWIEGAIGGVLPGLRAIVEGPLIERSGVEVLAQIPGVWVGRVTG